MCRCFEGLWFTFIGAVLVMCFGGIGPQDSDYGTYISTGADCVVPSFFVFILGQWILFQYKTVL